MVTRSSGLSGWYFVGASVLLVSAAQLCLKVGLVKLPLSAMGDLQSLVIQANEYLGLGLIVTGLACYFLSFVTWLQALAKIPLSKAYPLLSLSYILVYCVAVSYPSLGETFSGQGVLGVLFIAGGAALVARSNNSEPA